MKASFPPYTRQPSAVPKQVKEHRTVADSELGGLKHVLIQMQDESRAFLRALVEEGQARGEYSRLQQDFTIRALDNGDFELQPNCDDLGESETVGEYMDHILGPLNCDGFGPYN